MMASIRAAQGRASVMLVEQNSGPGKKLLLTGKGRCNLTNACGLDDFLKTFGRNGPFLRDAFKVFFNSELMEFFERRGLSLKTERQERVFPATDRSGSVLQVLKAELEKNRVRILCNAKVQKLKAPGGRVTGVVLADGTEILGDAVILATGGLSYAFTGSTGEGLRLARETGHTLVSTRPGLVPLVTEEKFPAALSGLALKNIRMHFSDGRRNIDSEIGEMLFTDFGISGPLVLSLSSILVDWLVEKRRVTVKIDLKPALTEQQLDDRLKKEFQNFPKKGIKNLLKDFLPASLIEFFLKTAQVTPDKTSSHILQAERRKLIETFKGFPLRIIKTLPLEEAMVTKGGVSLKDIDPRTMMSRKINGLYFAGEIIDIDGDTGGFNLQAAFSTGYVAGQSAAGEIGR